MDFGNILITLGALAAAISTIGALVYTAFKLMIASYGRDEDMKRVKLDSTLEGAMNALDKRLSNVEKDFDKLHYTDTQHGEKLQDTISRLIKLETTQENIEKSLIKLESKLDNHNETVIALLQKLNK